MKSVHLFYLLFFLLLCSCNKPDALENALILSGENRTELERVLSYYKNDTEKYEIAKFLIINSQYHFSLVGEEVDSIKDALISADNHGVIDSIKQSRWEYFDKSSLTKKADIKELKSDYLIKNIDMAYDVWKGKPWNKELSISDFCEYILPYRIKDEKIENWRELYYNTFNGVLDSLYCGEDALEASTAILNFLQKEYPYNFTWVLEYPHLGGEFLLNNRVGKCRDACDFITYVFRAVGIPVACDFYTYSPETRKGHIWNSVKTKYGWLPFSYPYTLPKKNNYQTDSRSPSTIYRQTFSVQESQDICLPPQLVNRDRKNVSTDYFKNKTLTLKSNQDKTFVGVFNSKNWVPIASANTENGEAVFNGLGPNQIYIQLDYINGDLSPVGNPFVFDGENTKYFIPDTINLTTQSISRKFPLSQRVKTFMSDMIGGIICARSNYSKFNQIYIIDTVSDGYNNIQLREPILCKQLKYISPKHGNAQISEFHFFYLGQEKKPILIKGDAPATRGTFEWQINDNEPLSYFISAKHGASILFDFECSIKIDSISFIPRTDENWIRIGDIYELYYNINGKWVSLGVKVAKSGMLTYNNIPTGALLYLHNINRGEEELPFFFENGNQIFISQAKD